jgi:hypothetical protein
MAIAVTRCEAVRHCLGFCHRRACLNTVPASLTLVSGKRRLIVLTADIARPARQTNYIVSGQPVP